MLPLVFKMALPAVAAQFVNLLYNIVDRIYIGHIPEIGTNALAGIGVTTSIVILISSFSAIVGAGGSPLAAIALGQGDRERAGKIVGNGFILLILFTIFTSLITYTFMEPILLFTGASKYTLGYAVDYLSIYLLGTLFVEISTSQTTFYLVNVFYFAVYLFLYHIQEIFIYPSCLGSYDLPCPPIYSQSHKNWDN